MSYVELATDRFDEMARFYGETLGFPVVDQWDRANGRGQRFDLGSGLRLEILDNARERRMLELHSPGERTHIVIEVDDIVSAHQGLRMDMPEPQTTSWGARLFQVHDPDGLPVTFLQWVN